MQGPSRERGSLGDLPRRDPHGEQSGQPLPGQGRGAERARDAHVEIHEALRRLSHGEAESRRPGCSEAHRLQPIDVALTALPTVGLYSTDLTLDRAVSEIQSRYGQTETFLGEPLLAAP